MLDDGGALVLNPHSSIHDAAQGCCDKAAGRAQAGQQVMVSERPKLGGASQWAYRGTHFEDIEASNLELLPQTVWCPAAVIGGMGVVQPSAVGGQDQAAIRGEQPQALTQIGVQVPNVLEDLEGDDAVGGPGLEFEGLSWLEYNVDSGALGEVAGQISATMGKKQGAVGGITCAQIDDGAVLGQDSLCNQLVEGFLQGRDQFSECIGIVSPQRRVESHMHGFGIYGWRGGG